MIQSPERRGVPDAFSRAVRSGSRRTLPSFGFHERGELAGGAAALHFRQLDGDVVARLDLDQ